MQHLYCIVRVNIAVGAPLIGFGNIYISFLMPRCYEEYALLPANGMNIAYTDACTATQEQIPRSEIGRERKMQYTIFDTPILSLLLRWWSRLHLRIFGWRMEGEPPDIPKYIVIAAPHTTNWELPTAIILAFAFRIKVYWMGKDNLFRRPFDGIFRWLGGIPVNRGKSTGLVAQTVEAFNENEKLVIVMAPEGTRSKTRHWRTGFYHIAQGAGVPIALGFLDYRRKACGIGPVITPTGDIDADMREIRAFYAGITGKHPEKSSQAAVGLKSA